MSYRAFTTDEASSQGFIADLSDVAEKVGNEDWQAGGNFVDILTDLKREGHIGDELYIAGCRLLHDMTRVHGASTGLTAKYDDKVDTGSQPSLPPRFAADLDAFTRMNSVLCQLRDHERAVLAFCILSRELQRGSMSDWGRQHSAYVTAKRAHSFAVGQIKSLLESLSEIYRSRIPLAN